MEAIQSLAEFHDGIWEGQATSFSVTQDVAAGIVHRVTSPKYKKTVKVGVDMQKKDFKLIETIAWEDKFSSREISTANSNMDVDAIDGSYSLDMSLPSLPSEMIGTDKLPQFLVEHCIAMNDNERARCLVLYGMDQALMRIVFCKETRIKEKEQSLSSSGTGDSLTAADLLEMQSDVDRLVDKLTGQGETPGKNTVSPEDRLGALQNNVSGKQDAAEGQGLLRMHNANLFEITSGVWLGDLIIRDLPFIPLLPNERGQGFGAAQSKPTGKESSERGFGKWSIGVQKSAWRWMWNFGEEVRQIVDSGRAMGAEFAGPTDALPGNVCVNEGFARRIPKEGRMVYVDWSSDDSVTVLSGSMFIHVPRYLTFNSNSKTRPSKPIFTEFGVFSSNSDVVASPKNVEIDLDKDAEGGNVDIDSLPKIACSKISRVYSFEGLLKQGCSAFYILNRFGAEKDDALA